MKAYLMQFWKIMLGGYLFGILLTILLGIPWQFTLSLVIFVFILNTVIEQAKALGAIDLAKKIFAFMTAVMIFVGLRSVAGYLLDLPTERAHYDLVAGNGIAGITTRSITTNVVFELLFLVPGVAIAYLVVKKGWWWRTTLVLACTMLLAWVTWTMKQRVHAEAMKRSGQATISLSARGLNNKALVNEAAAATSFGVAKARVSLFYQQDGTNGFVQDPGLKNWSVLPGAKVKQLQPDALPVMFEGEAFTQVVLPNTNGSFIGGSKTWVEAWRFNWVDGGGSTTNHYQTGNGLKAKLTLKRGDKLTYRLGPNEATPWIEVPKGVVYNIDGRNFRVYFLNGHPPIDVGDKDVIFPDVAPTIIRVGSLVPDNTIEITGT